VEQTGFHVYIAALAPTDHSSSIEYFKTNQHNSTKAGDLLVKVKPQHLCEVFPFGYAAYI
jgi:hypothetical protein